MFYVIIGTVLTLCAADFTIPYQIVVNVERSDWNIVFDNYNKRYNFTSGAQFRCIVISSFNSLIHGCC